MLRTSALGLLLGVVALPQQGHPNTEPVAAWPQEPEGFLGIPFNASTAAAKSRMDIGECLTVLGVLDCLTDLRLGDFSFVGTLEFKNDRFVSVYSSIPAAEFGTLKDIFIARYGKPQ